MTDLFSAFVIGLMGAGHCIGMCGGLALASGMQKSLADTLLYNIGRISSYTLLGLMIGLLGYWLTDSFKPILNLLRLLSGFLLIFLGLYISQWYMGLAKIEQLFSGAWRIIAPAANKQIFQPGKFNRFIAGTLWGWLPCGLVYSVLTWAATQASPIHSASIMLAFGLGTCPAMLLSGMLSQQLAEITQNKYVRSFFGFTLIGFGLYSIFTTIMQMFANL
ncbi:sulfite exporter TauE/SafE family protein [Catenovulum sediminis]|uniref:Sulfite exporter TauE/SafE family protein n=1 Tax=Catenovulum sediminis TaxID=1740262 RepID=A0ABV1RJC6_9ALTE|nr:sulfite exporter TauE/SafE family protein [Catenovulum sediminis]